MWYSGGGPDLPFSIEGIRYAFGDSDTSVALPSLVFIISMIISFATGTSWGTMAIVIPLALPLAKAIEPNVLLPTLGSVLAGAIFGDHCSPISDTTIMSAMAAAGDLMDHVKTQLPYAITAAIVSMVMRGWEYPP